MFALQDVLQSGFNGGVNRFGNKVFQESKELGCIIGGVEVGQQGKEKQQQRKQCQDEVKRCGGGSLVQHAFHQSFDEKHRHIEQWYALKARNDQQSRSVQHLSHRSPIDKLAKVFRFVALVHQFSASKLKSTLFI